MAYTKQTFSTGQTLKASDLNTMSEGITTKQDKLVSGTNIKTINGENLLGSGDIPISTSLPIEKCLVGKVCSVLGDSISTFKGYIPTDHEFNGEVYANPHTYPSRDVTSWDKTWWGQVISKLGMTLGVNDSWSGSRVHNSYDSDIPASNVGPNVCMAGLQRIQKLGTNGTPDVIFVYGGTNDAKFVNTGTFDSTQVYSTVDLEATKWSDFAAAYTAMIMRLQYYYPDAILVALKPMFVSSWYDNAKLSAYCDVIQKICDYFGVICIDLRKSGINYSNIASRLPDGLHPNATQMANMANYIVSRLASELRLSEGSTSSTVAITGLSASSGTSLSVEVGKTVTCGVSYSPTNTTQRGVTWTSSSTSVATVSSGGVVTGVAEGSATITAKSIYNNSLSVAFNVTVSASSSGGGDSGGEDSGGDDTGGDGYEGEVPSETTWYVDFTNEVGNYNYPNSSGGVTHSQSATYSKCVGVPINAVKLLVGADGTMGYGKVASDGDTYTELGTITLSGASSTASEATAQTFKLNSTVVLAEGERLVVMAYGNDYTGKIWVSTSSTTDAAKVRTNIRSVGVSKDENWKLLIGIGYVV